MTEAGLLYAGEVVHERFAPRRHRLRYRIFQMLIDIDQAPALAARLRLFSYNGANLFSLNDADHGDGTGQSLRAYAEATLGVAGLELKGGRILIQCMPRILGYAFNPLTLFYCYDAAGELAAMIYEVHNTFGQRHSYVIPVAHDSASPVRQSCGKALHVSPFMGMDMTYAFTVRVPAETVSTVISGLDPGGAPILYAAFNGRRRAFTDTQLLRMFVAYPLLTLKVMGAIHLEAVKLWLKGLGLRPAPPSPSVAATVGVPVR